LSIPLIGSNQHLKSQVQADLLDLSNHLIEDFPKLGQRFLSLEALFGRNLLELLLLFRSVLPSESESVVFLPQGFAVEDQDAFFAFA
jgi:hypothetical protein